ncbi:Uncharacterised protein [Mycobacteroides abscessus subsp. abscessus]|nr:Uncharacterised protein [Mycobacteroides abscessus subsp. abscessus]
MADGSLHVAPCGGGESVQCVLTRPATCRRQREHYKDLPVASHGEERAVSLRADNPHHDVEQLRGATSCGDRIVTRRPAGHSHRDRHVLVGFAQAERERSRRHLAFVSNAFLQNVVDEPCLCLPLDVEAATLGHPMHHERLCGALEHHRRSLLLGVRFGDDQPGPVVVAATDVDDSPRCVIGNLSRRDVGCV